MRSVTFLLSFVVSQFGVCHFDVYAVPSFVVVVDIMFFLPPFRFQHSIDNLCKWSFFICVWIRHIYVFVCVFECCFLSSIWAMRSSIIINKVWGTAIKNNFSDCLCMFVSVFIKRFYIIKTHTRTQISISCYYFQHSVWFWLSSLLLLLFSSSWVYFPSLVLKIISKPKNQHEIK